MTLIYSKPGNAYTSAVTCTLEGEEIVIRDGSGVTRLNKTGRVILRIAEICNEPELELGPVGLELKGRWLERLRAHVNPVEMTVAQILEREA